MERLENIKIGTNNIDLLVITFVNPQLLHLFTDLKLGLNTTWTILLFHA